MQREPSACRLRSSLTAFGTKPHRVVLKLKIRYFCQNHKSSHRLVMVGRSNFIRLRRELSCSLSMFVVFYASFIPQSAEQLCHSIVKLSFLSYFHSVTFASTYLFCSTWPNPRTLSHKSSFILTTCNLFLPSSCFPESYNLPTFKSKINKLDLISLSP